MPESSQRTTRRAQIAALFKEQGRLRAGCAAQTRRQSDVFLTQAVRRADRRLRRAGSGGGPTLVVIHHRRPAPPGSGSILKGVLQPAGLRV